MSNEDPNKNVPLSVLMRCEEASLTRCMANILDSINALREEYGLDWSDVWPSAGEAVLDNISSGRLTIKQLNKIVQRFGLEPHVIFRPRMMRATVQKVML